MRILRLFLAVIFVAVSVFAIRIVLTDDCDTTICCEDCETIAVTRIIDGDTFDSGEERIRLYGMDTPERGEACFGEATERLRELAGDKVRIESGPRKQDRFRRSLYYIFNEDGESIDEILVREGFARAWTQDGQHREILIELEVQARQDSVGCLW